MQRNDTKHSSDVQRSVLFDSIGDFLDKENIGDFIGDFVGDKADSVLEFLADIDLPEGLLENLGVALKAGKDVLSQVLPDLTGSKKATILGLDNSTLIHLDLETSEPINVYHPDQYVLSSSKTYVTEIETGDVIKLNTFYASDDENQLDIVYTIDEDGYLETVRASPKPGNKEPSTEEELENELARMGKTQNFQRSSNVLVGYFDDDLDMAAMPTFDGIEIPEEEDQEVAVEDAGDRNHRRAARTDPASAFGKTCSTWDYLGEHISTITGES